MIRIAIPTLAAAISLAVFACSDSPSGPSTEGSSSSKGLLSSSSVHIALEGGSCNYFGQELFLCVDVPGDLPLQNYETACENADGTWETHACPSGEKIVCKNGEDIALYKLYADDFACSDYSFTNADGSPDNTPKGGACGPFEYEGKSVCTEFPRLSIGMIKMVCAEQETTFVNECPGPADLICYKPEDGMIAHGYGEEFLSLTCEDLDMQDVGMGIAP